MRNQLLLFLLLFTISAKSQNFEIRLGSFEAPSKITAGSKVLVGNEELKSFELQVTSSGGKKFELSLESKSLGEILETEKFKKFTSVTDLRGKKIQILDNTGTPLNNLVIDFAEAPGNNTGNTTDTKKIQSLNNYIASLFPSISATEQGIFLTSGATNFKGEDYTHLFFDQFGGLIFSAIPQGIANNKYVAHVFYQTLKADPDKISYTVEAVGEFDDKLVILNSGAISGFNLQNNEQKKTEDLKWEHREFLLPISTNNLKIDIYRANWKGEDIDKKLISTYTVKMAKIYHAAINVGLVRTNLIDPAFTLVTSPSDPNKKVVKQDENSNKGVVTIFSTFYFSPVAFLRKNLGGVKMSNYRVMGRNFLDDHKLLERIYPAIGVKLGDKAFENIFVGLNWEIARGGSFFIGRHYGKVNTFDVSDSSTLKNFKFGETEITESQFNIRQGSEWQTNWVFGANIDISIVTELFKAK